MGQHMRLIAKVALLLLLTPSKMRRIFASSCVKHVLDKRKCSTSQEHEYNRIWHSWQVVDGKLNSNPALLSAVEKMLQQYRHRGIFPTLFMFGCQSGPFFFFAALDLHRETNLQERHDWHAVL